MRIIVGSVIVVLLAALLTLVVLSPFYNVIGGTIKKRANKIKNKLEEKNE